MSLSTSNTSRRPSPSPKTKSASANQERHHAPILLEAESATWKKLSWFVDGEFLGTAPTCGRLWWTPRQGTHTFVVTDGSGRSSTRTLKVVIRCPPCYPLFFSLELNSRDPIE